MGMMLAFYNIHLALDCIRNLDWATNIHQREKQETFQL